MVRLRNLGLLVVVLAVLGICSSEVAADYLLTDLSTPGVANGINQSGQVVGYIPSTVGQSYFASLWQNGTTTDLGVGLFSYAVGINNAGQVVGAGPPATTGGGAFLWQNGHVTFIGPGIATGINASGQIVGSNGTNAFLWQNGTLTDLGPGFANAINASGQIVGSNGRDSGQFPFGKIAALSGSLAILWQNGTMTELGPGYATAINASGQIVGSSNSQAALWQNGTMTSLGAGVADDMNNLGQIVGNNGTDAFLWQNGTMTDLNNLIPANSGWVLKDARAINDAGQIAGWGIHNGVDSAFLLTPTAAPVPEPSTLLLLGIGTLGLFGYAWRRCKLAEA